MYSTDAGQRCSTGGGGVGVGVGAAQYRYRPLYRQKPHDKKSDCTVLT
jgi:hypothetical protein